MKKLGLISALSLGLVLLAGCTTNKPVTIHNGDEMLEFYNNTKTMTCTLNVVDEEEGEALLHMYFKDGMLSQTSKITTLDGEVYNDYAIAKDGVTYGWGDQYGENGITYEEDIDIADVIGDFGEVEEGTTVTCVKGVKDDSVFNIPSDVEFISANDLFGENLDDYYYDEVEGWDEYNDENIVVDENNGEVVEGIVEEVTE